MDLKNTLAVCLISLFSATLVLLVARSLDNQAAARLEPHLAQIAAELRAIRAQGGVKTAAAIPLAERDALVMYYFHGHQRCPTCEAIESQAYSVLRDGFADAVEQGEIVWKVADYEDAANADLASRFEIQVPVVVLARFEQGKLQDWKRLDEVWSLWDDKPAFAAWMHGQIESMR